MPVQYYNGTERNEATDGNFLYSGRMRAYIFDESNPGIYYDLGGYRIEDAFDYNITDFALFPSYGRKRGENISTPFIIDIETVKSITFEILAPPRAVDILTLLSRRSSACILNMVLVQEECDEGCDSFFYFIRDVRIGRKRFTSGVLAYDEDRAPITVAYTLRASGMPVKYQGAEVTTFEDALTLDTTTSARGFFAWTEDCTCACPNQHMWAASANPVGVWYSDDGGANWTAVDVSGISPAPAAMTHVRLAGERLIVDYNGTFAYIDRDNPTVAVQSTVILANGTVDVPPFTNAENMEYINGRIYLADESVSVNDYMLCSADGGASYQQVDWASLGANGSSALHWFDNDPVRDYALGVYRDQAEAFFYGFNIKNLTLTAYNLPTGYTSDDVNNMYYAGNDRMLIAMEDGTVWEAANYTTVAAGGWTNVLVIGEAIAGTMVLISEDPYHARTIIIANDNIYERSGFTLGDFNLVAQTGETVNHAPFFAQPSDIDWGDEDRAEGVGYSDFWWSVTGFYHRYGRCRQCLDEAC